MWRSLLLPQSFCSPPSPWSQTCPNWADTPEMGLGPVFKIAKETLSDLMKLTLSCFEHLNVQRYYSQGWSPSWLTDDVSAAGVLRCAGPPGGNCPLSSSNIYHPRRNDKELDLWCFWLVRSAHRCHTLTKMYLMGYAVLNVGLVCVSVFVMSGLQEEFSNNQQITLFGLVLNDSVILSSTLFSCDYWLNIHIYTE